MTAPLQVHDMPQAGSNAAIELDRLITRQIALDEVPSVISRPAAAGEVKMMFVP